ncbi:HD domain-containing protein [Nonomuraea jabiensis]|uniref:HD domain-containing protein n=1 Tax=Nonomuraea jabiensis TaxID=882448 RepID=UPI003D710609
MHDLDSILAALDTNAWPAEHHGHALAAATLSLAVYEGRVRDQGTPYIEHPLAVVAILRDELHVSHPETLILGLLHDAIEVTPSSEPEITIRLGRFFAEQLRAMTPDHRLEGRSRRATDEAVWRTKMRRLSSNGLLIRFADRIHNLRDLRHSRDVARNQRFISSLVDFYIPLAQAAQTEGPELKAAYEVLLGEYDRYRTSGTALA